MRRSGAPRIVLLRPVGSGTPIHRLWAGTKLVAVVALSVVLSFHPYWPALGLGAALVAAAIAAARVPLSARPRLGWWFWAAFAVGGALTLLSGGAPKVDVAGVRIGLGGVEYYLQFASFAFILLAASLLVGWTTPAAEMAPALSTLGRPFRWLRLPVDEWAVTVALCVRSLPLLVEEIRTLVAARRLRPRAARADKAAVDRWLDEAVDLMSTALVVSLRRAGEMAEAMTARGGTGALTARRQRPGRLDVAAGALVAAVCVGAWILPA